MENNPPAKTSYGGKIGIISLVRITFFNIAGMGAMFLTDLAGVELYST